MLSPICGVQCDYLADVGMVEDYSQGCVVKTRLNTAEGDGGSGGDDDVGEDRAHGADGESNAQYLARKDKCISISK